ncbi:MAG: alkaline phosphatase family protein, partial [Gemmatimonadetes bacterium]|nr:alkaline phosphatase family protein [Gemmatimonadota bacterium]
MNRIGWMVGVGLAACVAGAGRSATGVGMSSQPQSPRAGASSRQTRPRLAVVVVVDQLATHMMDRYADVFTGGFRRLLDEGHRFANAVHEHALTETAAGHATLSTGLFPSRHGIVANDWFEQSGSSWRSVYSVSDGASPIVGLEGAEGRSPANLQSGGFADWLQAADPQAKVLSVSRKDRAAIPLAGRTRAHVYWMNPEAGRFVTSTYYRSEDPDWVVQFNAGMPWSYGDTVWTSTVPAALVSRARPDSSVFEGDGVHVTFPHRAAEEADSGELGLHLWYTEVPFPDAATLAFAKAGVEALDLGTDDHTDYLAISFSQTDAVGHDYGPTSLEQLDNLLRLDRLLDELFRYLDARTGAGRWVLAFSSDHGVMPEPELRAELGQPARRLLFSEMRALVQAANAGAGSGTLEEMRTRAAELLEANAIIADVMTERDFADVAPADSFVALYRNSWFPGRLAGPLARSGMW